MTELKQQIRENGIWYTLVGDYYIPNLTLPEEERSVGRYGRLHREYLKETRPHTYNDLILTDGLWAYLADLDEQAKERLNHIIRQFREKDGVTEELKKQNQMEWVRRMNSIRARAEEIVLHEMIYV